MDGFDSLVGLPTTDDHPADTMFDDASFVVGDTLQTATERLQQQQK